MLFHHYLKRNSLTTLDYIMQKRALKTKVSVEPQVHSHEDSKEVNNDNVTVDRNIPVQDNSNFNTQNDGCNANNQNVINNISPQDQSQEYSHEKMVNGQMEYDIDE